MNIATCLLIYTPRQCYKQLIMRETIFCYLLKATLSIRKMCIATLFSFTNVKPILQHKLQTINYHCHTLPQNCALYIILLGKEFIVSNKCIRKAKLKTVPVLRCCHTSNKLPWTQSIKKALMLLSMFIGIAP